jgi:serine/threonine protein kinase/Flp pilus assembly protein TadD
MSQPALKAMEAEDLVMAAVPDPAPTAPALAERLAAEMTERWQRGERPLTEDFLAQHPQLWQQPEAAIDLVYEELLLRQQHGLDTTAADLLRRFPQWRRQLDVLLRCHQLLELGLAPPVFPAPGEALGDLRLLAELGQGSRGRVYLATQPALADRPVVVKVTPRDGREHMTLARLQHTHIVPLYSAQDDPARNLRVLCMPYFGGTTLAQLLQNLAGRPVAERTGRQLLEALDRGRHASAETLPARGAARDFLARASYVQAVCWVGACLADALQYAHERGLVHLDVKPSNVLLAADGQPMLLDFHLARPPLAPAAPAPEWLGGTHAYMAPEQQLALEAVRRGQRLPAAVDGRADVYALGLLLYEALGGPVPVPAGGPPRLERLQPVVSMGLADILHKTIRARAAERYADAAAFAADLRRHLKNLPLQGVANRSWAERWRKWRRRRPHALRLLGMLLAVLLAAAAVVVLQVFSFGDRLDEAQAHLERGQLLRAGGQYGGAVAILRHGLDVAQGLPFHADLRRQLSEELRLALLQEAQAELELERQQRASGQLADAVATLRRGLNRLNDLPGHQDLRALFQDELRLTEKTAVALDLHQLVERLRFHYGEMAGSGRQQWQREAPRLAALWEMRGLLTQALPSDLAPALCQQVQEDLLDLAVLGSDLNTRWALDKRAAAREALDVLTTAEALLGSSRMLCRERQRHAEILGRTAAAQAAAQCAAELPPRTAWEHYALGRSLLRDKRLEEAAVLLHRAVLLEPGGLWPSFYEGVCAYQRARYEDAVAAFTACVALNPAGARCFANRGLAHAKLGRPDRALADYDQALRLEPSLMAAALNRGVLHLEARRYDEAAADFQRALEGGLTPGLAYYQLALAHRGRGDRPATMASLRLSLQHEPHPAEAHQLLQQLQRQP